MKVVTVIARILLGLAFTAVSILGFMIYHNPPPPPPGLAAEFMHAFFASGWVLVIDTSQLIAGVLLLINRYVPLALVILAGIFVNILTYHITMMPSGLPIPLFLLILWVIVAWPLRSHFAPLFVQKTSV
jgi:hypothetical protein